MITFKRFLEAEGMDPGSEQFGASAPAKHNNAQLKGSLTDNEKRVLAILNIDTVKSSPGLARSLMQNANIINAVKTLMNNFKSVNVTPDGITINQTGNNLAIKHGLIDPNTGKLTEIGKQLASTTPTGQVNKQVSDTLMTNSAPNMGM